MTSEESLLPDYYAILEVNPEAEAGEIRAAYRNLMRKYHPDSLPSEQRQDLEVIKRVWLINTAYDVLNDPARRATYDAERVRLNKKQLLNLAGLETRSYLVRCAKTYKTYKMLLVRQAGSSERFRVISFELIEDIHGLIGGNQGKAPRALPDGIQKVKPLRALIKIALPNSKKQTPLADPPPKFPSLLELNELYYSSDTLKWGEIDWAGFNCPACHTEFKLPDGKATTWCICGVCSRIACTGNLRSTHLGIWGRCPWCKSLMKVKPIYKSDEADDKSVRGEVDRSQEKLPELEDDTQPRLPE